MINNETVNELLCDILTTQNKKINASKFEKLSMSDWADIVQLSTLCRVSPLFFHCLKAMNIQSLVPSSILQESQQRFFSNIFVNMHRYNELSKVLKILQDDNIHVIVLKGMHLAEIVYNNIALRTMSDIDLLFRKEDLPRVEKKLLEMNYTLGWGNELVDKHVVYSRNIKGINEKIHIEAHWHILSPGDPFKINLDELWKRAQAKMIAGTKVLVLSPEDLLLYLCLHSSYEHLFEHKLQPFCDILEIIRYYDQKIDWEQIQSRSYQWGSRNCTYLTLALAKKLLTAKVPDQLLRSLKPHDFKEYLMDWASEIIFDRRNIASTLLPDYRVRMLFTRMDGKRLISKIMRFLIRTFPPPRIMVKIYRVPQDSKQVYFYYLLRLKYFFIELKFFFSRYSYKVRQLLFHNKNIKELNKKGILIRWLESV